MYRWESIVKFKWNDEIKEGVIKIVDENGTFENPDEPSYDISSEGVLCKHIPQSEVVEFVCMSFERMSDKELYEMYVGTRDSILECGLHQRNHQAYMDISKEVADRFFYEKGFINLENRKKLMDEIKNNGVKQ